MAFWLLDSAMMHGKSSSLQRCGSTRLTTTRDWRGGLGTYPVRLRSRPRPAHEGTTAEARDHVLHLRLQLAAAEERAAVGGPVREDLVGRRTIVSSRLEAGSYGNYTSSIWNITFWKHRNAGESFQSA